MKAGAYQTAPYTAYIQKGNHMSPEDIALCQRAIGMSNAGQKQAAFELFSLIHTHGNDDDVTLLYWLAFTTPSADECERAIDTIAQIEPGHPKLPALRAYQDHTWKRPGMYRQNCIPAGFTLYCPFCQMRASPIVKNRVSVGGWITLAVLLLVFFPLFWIGLLIREDYWACGRCGARLGQQ